MLSEGKDFGLSGVIKGLLCAAQKGTKGLFAEKDPPGFSPRNRGRRTGEDREKCPFHSGRLADHLRPAWLASPFYGPARAEMDRKGFFAGQRKRKPAGQIDVSRRKKRTGPAE